MPCSGTGQWPLVELSPKRPGAAACTESGRGDPMWGQLVTLREVKINQTVGTGRAGDRMRSSGTSGLPHSITQPEYYEC